MSTVTEAFYGIRCDFPECGELFEGYEYSYFYDSGTAASEASEYDWLTNFDGKDYCSTHTVWLAEVDDDDEHRGQRPLADTFENRLKVAVDRVVERAHRALEDRGRRLDDLLGQRGTLAHNTDRKLFAIFERTCKAWKPDITGQELFSLRTGSRP